MHLSLQGRHVEVHVPRVPLATLRRHMGNLVRVRGVVDEPRVPDGQRGGRPDHHRRRRRHRAGRHAVPAAGASAGASPPSPACGRCAPSDAAAAHDVAITGRATFVRADWNSLFVQDETAGIFVLATETTEAAKGIRPGDLLEIDGHTAPGDFAPIVTAARIRVRGAGAAAAGPAGIDLEALVTGALDSQLVEARGVVRGVRTDEGVARIDLAMAPRALRRVRAAAGRPGAMPAGFGINARLRIVAVVGARYNTRRQIIGTHFQVPSMAQVVVESAGRRRSVRAGGRAGARDSRLREARPRRRR